jgi:outer membrane protein assembly factor BamB
LDAGIELWKTSTSNNKPIFSGCTLIRQMDAVVVGCHDGSVSCLSLETGTILWVHRGELGSAVLGTPAMIIEGSSDSDGVIFGSTSGDITCLASYNGKLLKRTQMPLDGEIFSSPVVNGSSLFVGTRDSYLYKLSF